jgi:hypothetical protein
MARKINYPDEEARRRMREYVPLDVNFEYLILWMLKINDYCTWEELNTDSKENHYYGILRGVLIQKLNFLLKKGLIKKKGKFSYKITKNGKKIIPKLETKGRD